MAKSKNKQVQIRNSTAEFLTFAYQSGGDGVEVRVQDGTIWLSQKNMGLLFDTSSDNVGLHLKNIFADSELSENSTTENFSAVATNNKTYNIKHYNLDAIIAVGYRVNSKRATAFRQWATAVLRDFTLRGYLLDRKRMENGAFFDEDYFEHLLEEIREIRLSERRFYQKITDIYATAMDYNKDAEITKRFYAAVQNKLHFAIHGQTAAELIYDRADHTKERMGLTNWEKAPLGKIVKSDVAIAKNYLTEAELQSLGRIVNAYLDIAEDMATRKLPMTMMDWEKQLNLFLTATKRDVLHNAGKITTQIAKQHAEKEFELFRPIQDRRFQSDYDKQFLTLEQAVDKPKKTRKHNNKK